MTGEKNKKKITVPQDSDVQDAVETQDFKDSLVDTLKESNTARNEMKVVLHELIKQPDTIKEIQDIINKTDRDTAKAFWKKFGFAIWSGIVFVAGIILTVLIERGLGK